MAEARQFEERLQHAYSDGGFLVLTVRPSRMRRCEDELLRRFDLERVSFDDLLFEPCAKRPRNWKSTGPSSNRPTVPTLQPGLEEPDAPRRDGSAPKIAADLAAVGKQHLLLVHPGLIARYDQMAILETLRDKVGHDAPCPGLWVLVADDGQNDMPMLDMPRFR